MQTHLDYCHTERLQALLGAELDALMKPISSEQPCGEYLRGNGVYAIIQEARRQDQEVSQGVWQHDLKRADWQKVTHCAIEAFLHKTKDLQIGFWLLEAQIHEHGFTGVGPCMILLREMCERYWDTLHPQIQDDDIDYRINPVLWANDKLLPVLRLVPLTRQDSGGQDYNWADWEIAQRNEKAKENHSKLNKKDLLPSSFIQAVASTPIRFYQQMYHDLQNAIAAIDAFSDTLDTLCGRDAPTLNQLTRLLNEIMNTLEYLLAQRGISLATPMPELSVAATGSADHDPGAQSDTFGDGGSGGDDNPPGFNGGINSRQQAYEALARAAEYLVLIEPHSPAPYLVKKAIEWGNLSTPELYQELFVRYQGQLNIFELLGLDLDGKS